MNKRLFWADGDFVITPPPAADAGDTRLKHSPSGKPHDQTLHGTRGSPGHNYPHKDNVTEVAWDKYVIAGRSGKEWAMVSDEISRRGHKKLEQDLRGHPDVTREGFEKYVTRLDTHRRMMLEETLKVAQHYNLSPKEQHELMQSVIRHDTLDKYRKETAVPYIRALVTGKMDDAFWKQCDRHHDISDHHPEFWYDRATKRPRQMPTRNFIEMIGDWNATARWFGMEKDAYYRKRGAHEYGLHPKTRERAERELGITEPPYPDLYPRTFTFTQKESDRSVGWGINAVLMDPRDELVPATIDPVKFKHLTGQHDQSAHGRRGGSAGSRPEDLSMGDYLTLRDFQRLGVKTTKPVWVREQDIPPVKEGYQRFYHGTDQDKLASILDEGLQAGRGLGERYSIMGTTQRPSQFGQVNIVIDVPKGDLRMINDDWAEIDWTVKPAQFTGIFLNPKKFLVEDFDFLKKTAEEYNAMRAAGKETRLKHSPGGKPHNQKRHGWRFSGAHATNPELIEGAEDRAAYAAGATRRAGLVDRAAETHIKKMRADYLAKIKAIEARDLKPARDYMDQREIAWANIEMAQLSLNNLERSLRQKHDSLAQEFSDAQWVTPRTERGRALQKKRVDQLRERYNDAWNDLNASDGLLARETQKYNVSVGDFNLRFPRDKTDAMRAQIDSAGKAREAAAQYLQFSTGQAVKSAMAGRLKEASAVREAMVSDQANLRQRRDQMQAEFDAHEKRANQLSSRIDSDPKAKAEYYRRVDRMADLAVDMGKTYSDGLGRLYQQPGKKDLDIDAGFTEDQKKRVRDGVDEFNRLAGQNPHSAAITTRVRMATGRAHASGSDMITLDPRDLKGTIIHEMAHTLEHADPIIQDQVFGFYRRRTVNSPRTKLKDETGVDYDDHEMTRKDDFLHPYMGKDYSVYHPSGKISATEILSMGLQMFFEDPLRLALKDPDYFDFIYAVVRVGI